MKNIHGGKHATLLKLTLLHGCFSSFLNRTNGTKSRKTSHLYKGFQRFRHIVDVRISLQSGTSRKEIISNVKVYAIDHFETSLWIYSILYIICFNITGELLCSRSKQRTCAYQGGKKCLFFGKFCVLYFLVTSVLRFALLPYYRRFLQYSEKKSSHNFLWYVDNLTTAA